MLTAREANIKSKVENEKPCNAKLTIIEAMIEKAIKSGFFSITFNEPFLVGDERKIIENNGYLASVKFSEDSHETKTYIHTEISWVYATWDKK